MLGRGSECRNRTTFTEFSTTKTRKKDSYNCGEQKVLLCLLIMIILCLRIQIKNDGCADDSKCIIRERGRLFYKWYGFICVEASYFPELETMSAEVFTRVIVIILVLVCVNEKCKHICMFVQKKGKELGKFCIALLVLFLSHLQYIAQITTKSQSR